MQEIPGFLPLLTPGFGMLIRSPRAAPPTALHLERATTGRQHGRVSSPIDELPTESANLGLYTPTPPPSKGDNNALPATCTSTASPLSTYMRPRKSLTMETRAVANIEEMKDALKHPNHQQVMCQLTEVRTENMALSHRISTLEEVSLALLSSLNLES